MEIVYKPHLKLVRAYVSVLKQLDDLLILLFIVLPTFPHCKQQKAGWGLGMRLSYVTLRATDTLCIVHLTRRL